MRFKLFEFVDQDQRIGMFGLGNRQKRVARLSRIPALVGSAEDGAITAAGVGPPRADIQDLAESARES